MFKKIITVLFFSHLFTLNALANFIDERIVFTPKFSLNAAYTDGSQEDILTHMPHKTAAAMAELPIVLLIYGNIYADISYFIRRDYNRYFPEGEDGYFDTHNFQRANISYKEGGFLLRLGRQSYRYRDKDFVIFFGGHDYRENTAPTSLNGLRHGFEGKYLAYDLLLAKDTKQQSLYGDDSLIFGGAAGFNLGELFNIDAFYYQRNAAADDIDYRVGVYGLTTAAEIKDLLRISLGAAKNTGYSRHNNFGGLRMDMKGYAFNGSLLLPAENSLGAAEYSFNVYYGSGVDYKSSSFTPISQNLDRGFILGGTDILRYSGAQRKLSTHTPVKADIADLMVYSLKFKLDLDYFKYIALNGGIYNFSATTSNVNYNDIGRELNLGISYKRNRFGIDLRYGLFVSGKGIAEAASLTAPSGKKLQKIGLNTVFEFGL